MASTPPIPTFKGNKSYLPSKNCSHCGRVMTWRKAWAKNWEEIKYCSQACHSQSRKDKQTKREVQS